MEIKVDLAVANKPIHCILASIFFVIKEGIYDGSYKYTNEQKIKILQLSEELYQATSPLRSKDEDDFSTDIERLARLATKTNKFNIFKEFIDQALEFTQEKQFALIFDAIEAEYILKEFTVQYELQKFLIAIPSSKLKIQGLNLVQWDRNLLLDRE